MIDKRPFGGTCALRGCDPKKVLVSAAAAVDSARLLSTKGVRAAGLAIDWPELVRFKRSFTDPYPDTLKENLMRKGIETFDGFARFIGSSSLIVGDTVLEAARAIVIAAGARPADLPLEGRNHLITSDQFMDVPALPASVIFVGGGYISFEFAHIAARAGAAVTIVHRGKRPLEGFDGDLVDRLAARTRALGIDIRLEVTARAVEKMDGRYRLTFTDAKGEAKMADADLVVHGAGRIADVDDLDLDRGEITRTPDGIAVNEYLQSVSNPRVYAAGDCAATDAPALTPVAAYEGSIVATNLLEGHHARPDYQGVPSVVFTLPPLTRVGFTEEDARAKNLRFTVRRDDMSSWHSSRRLGEECAEFKVLIEEGSGRLLGAHVLAPGADETINLFALAMRNGITATRFAEMRWAYPTHASDAAYMV